MNEKPTSVSCCIYLLTRQEVHFVSAFCYLFRELERRDRRGETREGSGWITSKTGDNKSYLTRPGRVFCSLVKKEVGLNGESVTLRFDP